MLDEFNGVLMVTAMYGSVSMAAMPFVAVLAVSRGVHGMVASAVFFMHSILMGMMAVMMHGAVCAMGAGICMRAL
ncbi:MAG: hypothetical protein F4142_06885 [Nitrospira sp. SB0675_bin_23]|nr:hypothetical protein [Nitrospira sp. SB0667_bin_9]MYD32022.1 hypothetical protein [Nitrospira sp. SB0661_bin_20]MYH02288.1 hypothetical protein [Nitrospira sp. SB0675_bin_23]MYJ23796.1 hypothetical protein [Nitrospira sp. SB0673_bin_12]